MAIKLEKGQRINLEKSNGSKLTNFWTELRLITTVRCMTRQT